MRGASAYIRTVFSLWQTGREGVYLETGANSETDKQFLYNLYTALLKEVKPKPRIRSRP